MENSWLIFGSLIPLIIGLIALIMTSRTSGAIQSSGRTRRYLLYVPDSYSPEDPTALVFCFHGFVQWPAHQRGLSGWNRLADREGFLVVYPRGTGFPLRWQAQPTRSDPEGPDREVRFFLNLLEELCSAFSIDRSRVYVNGMSNGAGMAHLLACEAGDRIAAMGGVAGAYLYPRSTARPGFSVPVIAFHGVDDPVVPYQGGWSRIRRHEIKFAPVEDWLAGWAAHNGCDPSPRIEEIDNWVARIQYLDCREGAEAVLYRIEGAGHTWPGGGWLPVWLTGKTYHGINATELMWDFFHSQRRLG